MIVRRTVLSSLFFPLGFGFYLVACLMQFLGQYQSLYRDLKRFHDSTFRRENYRAGWLLHWVGGLVSGGYVLCLGICLGIMYHSEAEAV